MDHGGVDKGHGVLAEALGVPLSHLLDGVGVQAEAELIEEVDRLGGGDNLHVRPAQQNLLNGGGVVGLHVVDDQVVQGAAVQHGLHIGDELAAHGPVGGVKEDGLLIQQDVGVVADAVVQGVDILEEGQPVFVRAYPVEVVGDLAVIMHSVLPPLLFLVLSVGRGHSGNDGALPRIPGALSPNPGRGSAPAPRKPLKRPGRNVYPDSIRPQSR